MFNSLEQSVRLYGHFSDEHFTLLTETLVVEGVSKGHRLLKKGSVCAGVYFVNKGSFRQYEVSNEGVDITLNFFTESDWMLDHKSFTSQKPSHTTIEAVEKSEVFFLSVARLHQLIKKADVFFQLGRVLEHVTESQQYQNNRLTPEEKYELLLANRPHLIHKFPAKQIASYLGITPETLSRVRRKLIS